MCAAEEDCNVRWTGGGRPRRRSGPFSGPRGARWRGGRPRGSAAGGCAGAGGGVPHVLLGAAGELFAVLATLLLDRLARALRCLLRDLLAALECLLAGVLPPRLDVVGDGPDLAVLDA